MSTATAKTNYAFSGVKMHCMLTGKETNGTLCLFENSSSGNSQSPIHLHINEDETIIVYEGEMEAVIDGVTYRLKEGQTAFMPRGIAHQLRNPSSIPSRYAILCIPSGFEEFVADAGRVLADGQAPAPPTPEEIRIMKETAPQYGIELLRSF